MEVLDALQKRKRNEEETPDDEAVKSRRSNTTTTECGEKKTKKARRSIATKRARPSPDALPSEHADEDEGANQTNEDSDGKGRFPCENIARPTGNVPWTAIEILTYAPGFIFFRACADRFVRNGWQPMDVALVLIKGKYSR